MGKQQEILIGGVPKAQHVEQWRKQLGDFVAPPEVKIDRLKRKWLDVPYTDKADGQTLDIYLPDTGDGPYPVIVYIHGGGWFMGHKRAITMEPLFYVLERGYALVSVDYTLSDKAEFPLQVYEVKTAVRWLRRQAKQYRLLPERVALWGDSAGGHLAALAATSAAAGQLNDESLGSPGYSAAVQAVVNWYGPCDFLAMRGQLMDLGVMPPESGLCSLEELFLGAALSDAPELVRAANPETYITPEAPPFFIQHGGNDMVVPCEQSVAFAAKLEKAVGRDKVFLEILEGAAHADPCFFSRENLEKNLAFLDRILRG
ncbi:MAG: alpha/beta hydrolase [Firmicutes bacterium]|nr:alpha/beta hydrolase [Bacillota bacterium]